MNKLRTSPHCSITSYQLKILESIVQCNNIPLVKLYSDINVITNKNIEILNVQSEDRLYNQIYDYVVSIVNNGLLEHFFGTNVCSNSQSRAKNVINLGITNLKCDSFKRISVTDRIEPSLILTKTKKYELSSNLLMAIGKFLVHVAEKLLPKFNSNVQDAFSPTNQYEIALIKRFQRQLIIDPQTTFTFPAISILINDNLNPHCDSLNPIDVKNDYTIVTTTKVYVMDIKSCIRDNKNIKKYGSKIPICVVIYNRQCLTNYSNHMRMRDKYISDFNEEITKKNGKKSIVDLLSSVDTDFDYSGNFLSRNRHERSISNFIVDKKIKQFNYGIFTTREAIDKLVRKKIYKKILFYSHNY